VLPGSRGGDEQRRRKEGGNQWSVIQPGRHYSGGLPVKAPRGTPFRIRAKRNEPFEIKGADGGGLERAALGGECFGEGGVLRS